MRVGTSDELDDRGLDILGELEFMYGNIPIFTSTSLFIILINYERGDSLQRAKCDYHPACVSC